MSHYHNFQSSLAVSHAAEDLPFWNQVYRIAFPTMAAMVNHRSDGFHQRLGIDRSIVLQNSKQILIDEKVRGRNKKTGKIYEDIALEFMSDEERGEPGWVCKSLMADYIAYAIAPLGRCYLLPVVQLQETWRRNGERWKEEGYAEINGRRILRAANQCSRTRRIWTTLSVNVYPRELYNELDKCMRIAFSAVELDE